MNQKNAKFNANNVGVGILDDPHIAGKTQKGITLIALVITIIVLLILAGVTISMVLGDDGIIAQAQKAKEIQSAKETEQDDELINAAGEIDTYVSDTIANLASKGEIKVGDFIEYEYLEAGETERKYTTPTGKNGVYKDTQTFDSAGADKITNWRVLSTEGGVIKLIGETSEDGSRQLTITGKNGYLNAPTVLNEMCDTLYSGKYGTAKSINLEDVNKAMEFDVTNNYYYYNNGEQVRYDGNEIKTIAKIQEENPELSGLATDSIIGAKKIGDLKISTLKWSWSNFGYGSMDDGTIGRQMIIQGSGNSRAYWVASQCLHPEYNTNTQDDYVDEPIVSYRIFWISSSSLGSRSMWSSSNAVNITKDFENDTSKRKCGVRPIVTLKSGLKCEDVGDYTQDVEGRSTVFNVWRIK